MAGDRRRAAAAGHHRRRARGDARCRHAVECFCAVFGAIAGDLALTLGAWDGVFLTGGLVPKMLPSCRPPPSARRFEAKGRFAGAMAQVPTVACCIRRPGLLGAAAFARQDARAMTAPRPRAGRSCTPARGLGEAPRPTSPSRCSARSTRGRARLLLSGGSTPAPVYRALARGRLDWAQNRVGLVDERWLPQDDPPATPPGARTPAGGRRRAAPLRADETAAALARGQRAQRQPRVREAGVACSAWARTAIRLAVPAGIRRCRGARRREDYVAIDAGDRRCPALAAAHQPDAARLARAARASCCCAASASARCCCARSKATCVQELPVRAPSRCRRAAAHPLGALMAAATHPAGSHRRIRARSRARERLPRGRRRRDAATVRSGAAQLRQPRARLRRRALGPRALREGVVPNLGIVSAYNDMLSAHQPFEDYPARIARPRVRVGATAQVAGGVPAMCDGVTQGRPGMELSLFSRDVIAQATAIALSHDMFDAAICLGVCDKIVPGLLIGALAFGHLPVVFAPAGPMTPGLSNREKAAVRERFAAGLATREELLAAETASYHSPGTCTFYGTANSNQCCWKPWACSCPAPRSSIPARPCATRSPPKPRCVRWR
jgi:hypothetical protein